MWFVLAALFVGAAATGGAGAFRLTPRTYAPLPARAITPQGWLLDRLQAQARGLDGGLDKWWPQVSKSMWMPNGNGTVPGLRSGPSTERVPYWLNGMVPLHTLLNNAAPNSPEALSTGTSTKRFISHILASQDPVTGWLGPNETQPEKYDIFWPRYYMLHALRLAAESADPDSNEHGMLVQAVVKHVHASSVKMAAMNWSSPTARLPQAGISKLRVQDYLASLIWLLEHAPANEQAFLTAHANTILTVYKGQVDYESWFAFLPTGGPPACAAERAWNRSCLGHWFQHSHGVSSSMGLKSAAVAYEMTGNNTLRKLSRQRVRDMDKLYGSAVGPYIADESYPAGPFDTEAARKNPSRGTELCAIVESMFSMSEMFSVFGGCPHKRAGLTPCLHILSHRAFTHPRITSNPSR
jgi:hypothetical protein